MPYWFPGLPAMVIGYSVTALLLVMAVSKPVKQKSDWRMVYALMALLCFEFPLLIAAIVFVTVVGGSR